MRENLSVRTNHERLREAIGALREYQPLAVHVLELALLLDRLADIALDDVRAINKADATLHMRNAIRHLEAVIDERRNVHLDEAMRHVEEALSQLERQRLPFKLRQ